MSRIRLIAGLGNPGGDYQYTRHNLGFLAVSQLAERREISWKLWREIAEIGRQGELVIARPLTFMNNSGAVIQQLSGFFKIIPEEILVISDDIALHWGEIRIRAQGSSGGHKGLESIIRHLGSSLFPRLRMGIGPLPAGQDGKRYVLGSLSKIQRKELPQFLEKAVAAVETILNQGLAEAMNVFNRKVSPAS